MVTDGHKSYRGAHFTVYTVSSDSVATDIMYVNYTLIKRKSK